VVLPVVPALTGSPCDAEVRVLRQLYQDQRDSAPANPEATKRLLSMFAEPAGCSAAEFAGWHTMAMVLLNLDESIT
jgi:hypothetical protein